MNRALWVQTWREGAWLLVACCVLSFGFICVRLWIVSQVDFEAMESLIAKVIPRFVERLLPVPIDVITSLEGRIIFGYEELPVLLLMALWTVSRGTECVAGRLSDGTLEMMLAQPVPRWLLVVSHTGVTVLGVVLVALTTGLATLAGMGFFDAEKPLAATLFLPAMVNLLTLGIFLLGVATLASALVPTRSQAVGLFVGFYVVQFTCRVIGLMSPNMAWLKKITFLSLYEPTALTIGLRDEPATYWPLFWQYNLGLVALGVAAFTVATWQFCRRDIPAPL